MCQQSIRSLVVCCLLFIYISIQTHFRMSAMILSHHEERVKILVMDILFSRIYDLSDHTCFRSLKKRGNAHREFM